MKEYLATMDLNCEVISINNIEYLKKTGQYEDILNSVNYWKEGNNKEKLINDLEEIANNYNCSPSLADTTKYEEKQMSEMMKEKENKKPFDYFEKWIKGEIEFELEYENGFIDESDNTNRYSMLLADRIIEGTEYTEDDKDGLTEYIEGYLKEHYKSIADVDKHSNYTLYYYHSHYNFKSVEDLEKHFNLGA